MYYLIYISTASKLMDQDELSALLFQSRKKNVQFNVTGMLMYSNGTFIQALEGNKEDVDLIYTTIKGDTRHKNLIEILTGEEENRTFPDWSMAFFAPVPVKITKLEGYNDHLGTDFLNGDEKNTMLNVLRTFADSNALKH